MFIMGLYYYTLWSNIASTGRGHHAHGGVDPSVSQDYRWPGHLHSMIPLQWYWSYNRTINIPK